MPKKKKEAKKADLEKKEKDDSKLFAFLATFLSIIGFIIALVAKKDDEYVMFYAKQSLVVFIVSIIAWIIGIILLIVPILGALIGIGLNIIVIVLWVISWIYALSGEMKKVPIVGNFADKIKL